MLLKYWKLLRCRIISRTLH